jgi:urease accessory protein
MLELLLADGRFPGGGFAHSGGLEAAVDDGAVDATGPSLAGYVAGRITTAGAVEAWLAARACAAAAEADALAHLEAEAEAHQPSPALRAAARAQGRGLRRSAAVVWPSVGHLRVEVYPVVLGAVAAAAGLDPAAAARLAVHGVVMACVSAAPKLLAIDMADAVAVAARLAPLADAVAADAVAADDCPVRSAPWCEHRADPHRTKEHRLFAS